MDANVASWWLRLSSKANRKEKEEDKKVIQKHTSDQNRYYNNGALIPYIQREYGVDKNKADEIRRHKRDQVLTVPIKRDKKLTEEKPAYYDYKKKSIYHNAKNDLYNILSHERSHVSEIPGIIDVGFQEKLYDHYKKKDIIGFRANGISMESRDNDPQYQLYQKSQDSKTLPYYIINKSKVKEKIPLIGQYGERANYPYQYHDGAGNLIGDEKAVVNYINQNYPGLLTSDDWKQEFRELRDFLNDKTGDVSEHSKNMYKKITSNKYLSPDYESFEKEKGKMLSASNEYLKETPKLKIDFLPQINNNDNNSMSHFNFQAHQRVNLNTEEGKEVYKYLDPDELLYFWSPTETKARLKTLKDGAIQRGYRLGTDITPYIDVEKMNGIEKEQYYELKRINKMEDSEIIDMMDYISQNKENSIINSYNNMV